MNESPAEGHQSRRYTVQLDIDRSDAEIAEMMKSPYIEKALDALIGLGLPMIDFDVLTDLTALPRDARTAFRFLKSRGFRSIEIKGINPQLLKTEHPGIHATHAPTPTGGPPQLLTLITALNAIRWDYEPQLDAQQLVKACVSYHCTQTTLGDSDYMRMADLLQHLQTLHAEYTDVLTRLQQFVRQVETATPW